ncbi:hypothetical protein G9A89_006749 [Geosiphon pyriformis]|nr:hypothetical protein G9A89_006749 [Geosiphon pyriformis]
MIIAPQLSTGNLWELKMFSIALSPIFLVLLAYSLGFYFLNQPLNVFMNKKLNFLRTQSTFQNQIPEIVTKYSEWHFNRNNLVDIIPTINQSHLNFGRNKIPHDENSSFLVANMAQNPYPKRRKFNHKFYPRIFPRIAIYANWAYCRKSSDVANVIDISEAKAFVYRNERFYESDIIVYFQGRTLTRSEWQQRPINLQPYKYEDGKPTLALVDAVWKQNVDKMVPRLVGKINGYLEEKIRLKIRFVNIFFTGHAVGGVYAILAATAFKQKLGSQWELSRIAAIAFGSPRFGNKELADLMNSNRDRFPEIYRITHSNDWLPRMFPPPSDFRHVETEVWIWDPNCDCTTPKDEGSHPIKSEIPLLFSCEGYKKPQGSGENQYCNAGTLDSNPVDESNHFGPYFKIIMNKCPAPSDEDLLI